MGHEFSNGESRAKYAAAELAKFNFPLACIPGLFDCFKIRWPMSAHHRSMRTNGECRAKYAAAELAKFIFPLACIPGLFDCFKGSG
jgi:hypothetical protein